MKNKNILVKAIIELLYGEAEVTMTIDELTTIVNEQIEIAFNNHKNYDEFESFKNSEMHELLTEVYDMEVMPNE